MFFISPPFFNRFALSSLVENLGFIYPVGLPPIHPRERYEI